MKIDLKIYQETYMWERRFTKKLTCERGMAKMNYEPSFNHNVLLIMDIIYYGLGATKCHVGLFIKAAAHWMKSFLQSSTIQLEIL